jgi:hypothetical protein
VASQIEPVFLSRAAKLASPTHEVEAIQVSDLEEAYGGPLPIALEERTGADVYPFYQIGGEPIHVRDVNAPSAHTRTVSQQSSSLDYYGNFGIETN